MWSDVPSTGHEQKTQNPGDIDAYYYFTTCKTFCTTLWTTKSQEGMGSKRYDFPLPDAALQCWEWI